MAKHRTKIESEDRNDDSKVFSMLLNANPQLHNVSKARAEKILRNRFPEYF